MSLISVMRNRMVVRDKSIDDNVITEGISIASMLPGPVAVNVVAYAGYRLAGIGGAVVSLVSVLMPSFFVMLALTMLYIHIGDGIGIHNILLGVFPIVAGLIFSMSISMAKKSFSKFSHYGIAAFSFLTLLFLEGYWPILLVLFVSGLVGCLLFRNEIAPVTAPIVASWKPILLSLVVYGAIMMSIIIFKSGSVLAQVFQQFSYISLTLFGGGYVMIPVLENILVEQLNWFTNQEFVYGISTGQVTPGPILISAVFFGYKMAGIAGALMATIGIFLPSAMLMILSSKVFFALKDNAVIQSVLMGTKPAVIGMIFSSGYSIFTDQMSEGNVFVSLALTGAAFILISLLNVSAPIIIVLGGLLGFLIY